MLLKDFYRETVAINEEENATRGWASCYYGVFSKVINDNNYKRIVEVGIGYGTHAKYILKTTNIEKLYLVDPMVFYPNDGFANDIMTKVPEIPYNNFNELHDLIKQELTNWEDKYTWFRTKSLDVSQEQIPDNSVDCIFLDGDHSYDAVKQDLKFWWKKLKVGGQLLGDDYWMHTVSKAVEEFSVENSLSFDFLFKENTDYKIYRFKK